MGLTGMASTNERFAKAYQTLATLMTKGVMSDAGKLKRAIATLDTMCRKTGLTMKDAGRWDRAATVWRTFGLIPPDPSLLCWSAKD